MPRRRAARVDDAEVKTTEPAQAPVEAPLTSSRLTHVKDVRITRVPTPQSVKMYGKSPSVLRPMAARYHTAPCSQCDSRCCQEKVCVNIVDLARMVLYLGVAPEELVVLDPEHQSTLTIPALIQGTAHHMLLRRVPTEGLPMPACHMVAYPGGHRRCGIHSVRPGVCRAYPFSFYTDRGRFFYVGLPVLCPISWALTDEARRALELEIVAWRDQNDHAERHIKRWNREHGDEGAGAFFRFAVEKGALKLGIDPRPYLLANTASGFTRKRLW
ncbi:MAG: YkgJ family cysteine cluster protein [Pseudomonadota bacterium]